MTDKKVTPREAAIAVLKKAEELYKSSSLAKGDWAKIHSKLKREGYSEESADKIDGAIKAKLKKDEPMPSPSASPAPQGIGATISPGNPVAQSIASTFKSEEAAAKPMKGHIKLAKFVGRMEHKRGKKAGAPEAK